MVKLSPTSVDEPFLENTHSSTPWVSTQLHNPQLLHSLWYMTKKYRFMFIYTVGYQTFKNLSKKTMRKKKKKVRRHYVMDMWDTIFWNQIPKFTLPFSCFFAYLLFIIFFVFSADGSGVDVANALKTFNSVFYFGFSIHLLLTSLKLFLRSSHFRWHISRFFSCYTGITVPIYVTCPVLKHIFSTSKLH